ncbi:PTS system, glucose-specific IIA component [Propionispira arboris]|uniref:PTS system, glucose-specific IIA component n=1 Tax=Propionispira arboris TaxID=84035 RepID=A0A1H7DFG2_9FIRM|nr:PTS glucose transporter subunit IIA [Propionispira arboris]SEJ96975.1 PTS system, glucose-specific IIA component [Propionispira arboris]
MFGLFNKKKFEIYAPVLGKVIDITEVEDAVFSSKMLGDGFAVEPETDCILAPCDGQIVLLAGTKHAVAIEKDGVQILIHVGLDTVELNGAGFEVHIKENDSVKQGDKLITFDRNYILSQEKKLTTIVVLTNMADKVKNVVKTLEDSSGKILVIEPK